MGATTTVPDAATTTALAAVAGGDTAATGTTTTTTVVAGAAVGGDIAITTAVDVAPLAVAVAVLDIAGAVAAGELFAVSNYLYFRRFPVSPPWYDRSTHNLTRGHLLNY